MKEHVIAEFTNELRDIAVKYGQHECVRSMLSAVVVRYVAAPVSKDCCPKYDAEQVSKSKAFDPGYEGFF